MTSATYSLCFCTSNHLWVLLIHSAETVFAKSLIQNALRELLDILTVSLLRCSIVVQQGLFIDKLLELSNLQTEKFEVKVKITNRFTEWLIVLLMEFSHIGMFKGTLDSDSLFGIKFKHFLAKIDSLGVLAHAEKFFEVFTSLLRQLLHKCFIVSVLDFIDQSIIWTSCQINNHLHLLSTVLSRHQWLSSNHFCKDTSNRPYINCCCILLP